MVSPPPGTPLILGIHGPPGEGKTFQSEQVLADLGVTVYPISGGELENVDAGQPSKLLRNSYLEAGRTVDQGRPAVLVLNDIDAAIGDWGNLVQYTVNRQNIIGELLHLCDFPTEVEHQTTWRIPILVTGNDLSKLYGPLRRHGRMATFYWEPTRDEREEVLLRLLPGLQREHVQTLMERYPARPSAFFADAARLVAVDTVADILERHRPFDVLRQAMNGALKLKTNMSLAAVIAAGDRLVAEADNLRDYTLEFSDGANGRPHRDAYPHQPDPESDPGGPEGSGLGPGLR
ncbi:MAG: AAA family ATPase [Chloroflexota bacterium]|nr:AAA family ATPase [Chloroflexota bacterium]